MNIAISKWRSLFKLRRRKARETVVRQRLRACASRFNFERLEGRRMLASLSDGGGTTLNIDLAANESLSIVSNGSSYGFSSNQTFNNNGVAAPSDFTGFGSASLVLQSSGLTRYSTINITDSAAGASVRFVDSSANVYSDNFIITLDSGTTSAVEFIGATSFTATSRIQISTDHSVVINNTASLSTVEGNISLSARNGITLNGKVRSATGTVDMRADSNADGNGSLNLISPSVLNEDATLTAAAGTFGYGFGGSLDVSADGNTALVGAYGQTIGSNMNQGSATVLVRTANGWAIQQTLTLSDGASGDFFGREVALSADGNTAVVATNVDTVGALQNTGSATIFVRSGSTWVERQRLTGIANLDLFGTAVSISADGSTILIGAPNAAVGTNAGFGTATVFVRSGSTWIQQHQFQGNGTGNAFGNYVALSADGNTAAVSSHREDFGSNVDQGAVTIYVRSGNSWTKQQKLTASTSGFRDYFGASVAISSDGSTILIGASRHSAGLGDQGAATVFVRNGSVWIEQKYLKPSVPGSGDFFGHSVALSADGNRALVGAFEDDIGANTRQGSATLFERSGNVWTEIQFLTASDGAIDDSFGVDVALSNDGLTAFVGAYLDGVPGLSSDAGSVRVFETRGGSILAGTGTVHLTAADIDVQGSIRSGASVTIASEQANRPMILGGSSAGALNVSNAELNRISAPSILLGGPSTGPMDLKGAITRGTPSGLKLQSSSTINVASTIDSAGGDISLVANSGIEIGNTIKSSGGKVDLQSDADANGTGTLVVSDVVLQNWVETSKLSAVPGATGDRFGNSVAISRDGSTAIVGVPGDDGPQDTNQGSAIVFVRTASGWTQQAKLIANQTRLGDRFGSSVALSDDGNTAIVSASGEIVGSNVNPSYVIVFTRSGSVWTEQQELRAVDTADADIFAKVAISADGNTAIVGAQGDDVGAKIDQGSATVFIRVAGVWTQQQRIFDSGGAAGDSFGVSVSLSADGNIAIIGAPTDDIGTNQDQGSAIVFVRQNGIWTEQQKLTSSNGRARDSFGFSVDLSDAGDTAIVGAPTDAVGPNSSQGSATIYSRSGNTWTEEWQAIDGSSSYKGLGYSVALNADGTTALVGLPNIGVSDSGYLVVYERVSGLWSKRHQFSSGGTDYFGFSIALTGDGKTALVGAPTFTLGTVTERGSASLLSVGLSVDAINASDGIVALSAADMNIEGRLVGGAASLVVDQQNRPIVLGNSSAGTLGLSDAELDLIFANKISIGNSRSGSVTVNSTINRSLPTAIELTAGGFDVAFVGPSSLNSNGGNITLTTSGSGSILSGTETVDILAGGGRIALISGSSGVGAIGNPLQIVSSTLSSITSGNGNQFLSTTGTTAIDAAGLNAGNGTIELSGGTIQLSANHQINDNTKLNIKGATFSIGAFNDTVDTLTLTSGAITGSTGTLTSTNTIQTLGGVVSATLAGANGLRQSSNGNTSLQGANTYTGSTIISEGTLTLARNAPNNISTSTIIDVQSAATLNTTALTGNAITLANLQTLKGSGTVSGGVIAASGSRIAPGAGPGPGTLNSGNVSFNSGSSFDVELNGDAVSLIDQLNVTGSVSLGNSQLNIALGFAPSVGSAFKIINNDSNDAIAGTFLNTAEGSLISVTFASITYPFHVSYLGGDGNDVVLTAIAGVLSLTVDPNAISEKNGTSTGTLTRVGPNLTTPITVSLSSSDTTEATVPTTVTIPANASSVTFQITAVDDNLLDGTQTSIITATALNFVSVSQSIQITDSESLVLDITPQIISERGGIATGTVSRSNTDIAQPITVTLASSDLSEATVPNSVTIPANQSSVTFTITAVDDDLLDGTQSVSVTATATGYVSDAKSLNVTDVETLNITYNVASISENGGTATGTVTRSNTDIAQPLIVSLSSSDLTEATVPATVTIPANQASVTFVVNAVDDNLLDGSQAVAITAVATGYLSGSATITVTDSETVALAIDKSSISEFGGTATGTVTRSNSDIAAAITVNLTNSDSSELSLPATVTIPANQASVTFALTAVDDNLLDGTQTVTIGASSAGYFGSSTSIAVTDYETIAVTYNKSSIAENGETAIATVTRSNTNQAAAITVTLSNSDSSEAVFQNAVTIPANQASASFAINAVDDTLLDGTQIVTLTASAAGYVSGSKPIDVTDVELITLTIDKSQISENGGTATGTVTRGNTDISLPITVNLSSSDTTEATVPATVTIAANQSSATFTITGMPDDLLDGTQSVAIVASSPGYFGDVESIDVTDAETFTVSIDRSSISENGGTAIGTVTRSNTNIAQAVVVLLTGNDPSEATVPSSVTIPAGQASTTFAVTAVDDNLLDGDQLVTITASAAQYLNGSSTITITDSETLALVINAPSISENGGTTTGRVTRSNTDIALPLVVTLLSNDASEAVVPNAVTIPANQSFVVFAINAVDDTLLDGTQSAAISASATGYFGASQSLQVTDAESLSVAINAGAINEVGGSAIGTVTRSNTDNAQPLTVNLASSLTSEATVPASVTIPANAASVTFTITAVDDGVLDGTKTVVITASSLGYADGSRTIDVTDSVLLSLTFAASSISENGGSTTATVTRSNSNTSLPLTVQLLSSDLTEATVPATVTIPANQASVTFPITGVDDTLLDGTQSVSITASASGYQNGIRSLEVTDAESLTISISLTSISESGGTTTGTVTRSNSDNAQPLVVTLLSNDTSEVDVPTIVTIPANQASATFTILAVDDTLLDGKQTVLITASATFYTDGTRTLEVTDSESLTVTIDAASISEFGGTATGTVTRSNTDRDQPLTVTLQSNDTSEANVPASVTIPAGQASATFAVAAVDDALIDGLQSVAIAASATGYFSGSQVLNVTDLETISVVLSLSTISENGGSTTATVTRSNTDNSQPLTVTLLSSDPTEATVPATVVIPANQASISFVVTAVDDTLLDGTQAVTITASSPGYSNGSQVLSVSDAETLTVAIDATSISENGGFANGTVTRSNTELTNPLTVTLTVSDPSEATVPLSVTIPANQSSVSFTIASVDDELLDGTQSVAISAASSGYFSGSQTLNVTDFENLSVVLGLATISENGGSTTATVTRSNTDNSQPLTVTLLSSDTSELTVPTTVVIPANQASISFIVTGVDDTLLDGTQPVTITASSSGYTSGSRDLSVSDAETLSVTIDATSIAENGGLATGTITRSNTDISNPLTVVLTSSDTSEATVPLSVTIPANQSAISFSITGVDDALLDGLQAVAIVASATGYSNGTQTLNVTDFETLSVVLSLATISENGGSTTATLTRSNTDNSQAITVTVLSSDTTEAAVPTTITIPANEASISFIITAVDDTLLDGTQSVTVTASSLGYVSASQSLTVTDAEALTLALDATSISENGGLATGTVTRSNTDFSVPLTVILTSSDTSEATVPFSVTIPANQTSVTFLVPAVDDSLLDGAQSPSLSAAAVGYASAQSTLAVTDSETVSLTINAATMSEKGGKVNGLVTRSNTDNELPLTVNLQSNDTSEAIVAASVIIPANASSVSLAIDAVDDALLDGTQTVSIQVSAANYSGSTASLTVTDSESLSVTINVSSMIEKNGVAVGTVSRSNTDTAQLLVVQLVSDDITEATVPASVTIPANQAQVTFTITSVNDHLIDGNQTVNITASASDYESGTASLIVRDDDPNFPWQNARNRFDVNNDGLVSPIDALLVINALNVRMILTPELPDPFIPVRYVDVSGDGILSPIDALLVINELNRIRNSGEGEATNTNPTLPPSTQSNPFEAVIDLLLEDQIFGGKRKRL